MERLFDGKISKEDRRIKRNVLKSYRRSVKNSWYVPKGYIFVTNISIKDVTMEKYCKHTENPDEYSWYIEILAEYREKYGDVRAIDICLDCNGKEWRGSEVSKYNFGDTICLDVALYVPIKTWLNVPFE